VEKLSQLVEEELKKQAEVIQYLTPLPLQAEAGVKDRDLAPLEQEVLGVEVGQLLLQEQTPVVLARLVKDMQGVMVTTTELIQTETEVEAVVQAQLDKQVQYLAYLQTVPAMVAEMVVLE